MNDKELIKKLWVLRGLLLNTAAELERREFKLLKKAEEKHEVSEPNM